MGVTSEPDGRENLIYLLILMTPKLSGRTCFEAESGRLFRSSLVTRSGPSGWLLEPQWEKYRNGMVRLESLWILAERFWSCSE